MSGIEFLDSENTPLGSRISRNVTLLKPSFLVRLGILKSEKSSLTIYLVIVIISITVTMVLLYTQFGEKNTVIYREEIPVRILEKMPKNTYDKFPSKFSQ